jgi:hypothetical protein
MSTVNFTICYIVNGMQINYKLTSLALLLLLLGFASGYFLHNEPVELYQDPDIILSGDPECALNNAACKTTLANSGTIHFSIDPKPILGASPLSFNLSVEDIEVQAAVLDLKGVSMNMGSYRFELAPDGNGAYVAEGNLPVCVTNQMLWQADVWLKTPEQGLIKIPYRFTASKH